MGFLRCVGFEFLGWNFFGGCAWGLRGFGIFWGWAWGFGFAGVLNGGLGFGGWNFLFFVVEFGEICHFEPFAKRRKIHIVILSVSEISTEFKTHFLNLWILRFLAKAQYDKGK